MNFTPTSKKNSVEKTKKNSTKNSRKDSKKNSSKSSKKNSKKNSRKSSKQRSSTSSKQSTTADNRSSKSSKIKRVINKLITPFKKQTQPQLEEECTKVYYHPCRAVIEKYNGKLPYSYETYSNPETTGPLLDPEAIEAAKQIRKELRFMDQPPFDLHPDVGKNEVLRMTFKCMDPSKLELNDDQKASLRENKLFDDNGNRIRYGLRSLNLLLSGSSYLDRASIIVDKPSERAKIWPTEKENLEILENSSYNAVTSKPFKYHSKQESLHEAATTNSLENPLDQQESLHEAAASKPLEYSSEQQESPLKLQEKAVIEIGEEEKEEAEADISFDDTFTPPGTSYSKIIAQMESKETPITNRTRYHDSDISFDDTPPPTPRTPFNSSNWLLKSQTTPISTYTTNPSPLKKSTVNEPKIKSNNRSKNHTNVIFNNNSKDSISSKPKGDNNDKSKDKPTKVTFISVFQKPTNLKYKRKYQTTNQFPSYFFTNQKFTMHSSIDFISALNMEPLPSVGYNLKAIKCGNRNS